MKLFCLKCNKKFNSADKRTNRLCPKCKQANKHVYMSNCVQIPRNRTSKHSTAP